jgi:hypothetical protein
VPDGVVTPEDPVAEPVLKGIGTLGVPTPLPGVDDSGDGAEGIDEGPAMVSGGVDDTGAEVEEDAINDSEDGATEGPELEGDDSEGAEEAAEEDSEDETGLPEALGGAAEEDSEEGTTDGPEVEVGNPKLGDTGAEDDSENEAVEEYVVEVETSAEDWGPKENVLTPVPTEDSLEGVAEEAMIVVLPIGTSDGDGAELVSTGAEDVALGVAVTVMRLVD